MVIVEKPAKAAGGNAERYARDLSIYMRTAKKAGHAEEYGITLANYVVGERANAPLEEGRERVLAVGARSGDSALGWDEGIEELQRRLAKRSARSKKPLRHNVVSHRVGEDPSAEQCDETVRVLAEELGCEAGLILWALHGDTDNRHLHLLILTLDEAGSATPFGQQGRSREAMQRAIARLEYSQKLTPEPRARYVADADGVQRRPQAPSVTKRAPIRTEVLQWEAETGLESFTRFSQTMLAPLLEAAESWHDAQSALARYGTVVRKAGSGGEIQSGDGHFSVKLSSVDRNLAWSKLTRRWGEWSEPERPGAEYRPRVLDGDAAQRWAERDRKRDAVHQRVQARIDRLRSEKAAAIAQIRAELIARAADIAALRVIPAVATSMQSALRNMYAERLSALDDEYRARTAALRDLRDDSDVHFEPASIDLDGIGAVDCALHIAWPNSNMRSAPPDGFMDRRVGQSVQYWSITQPSDRPTFVERGDRIWINDTSEASLRAALIVAKTRYGDVRAYGDAAFILQAQILGEEMGIAVQACPAALPTRPRARSLRFEHCHQAVQTFTDRMIRLRGQRLRRSRDLWSDLLKPIDDIRHAFELPASLPDSPPLMPGDDAMWSIAALERRGLQLADLQGAEDAPQPVIAEAASGREAEDQPRQTRRSLPDMSR